MLSPALFASANQEWSTPADIIEDFGPFDLDVCATPENAKAEKYFTKADDGLQQQWAGRVWMNCPYGRGITGAWVAKARREVELGHADSVHMLLPARTDTRWFHAHIWDFDGPRENTWVFFLPGRLKFSGAEHGAPFPSVIVAFR